MTQSWHRFILSDFPGFSWSCVVTSWRLHNIRQVKLKCGFDLRSVSLTSAAVGHNPGHVYRSSMHRDVLKVWRDGRAESFWFLLKCQDSFNLMKFCRRCTCVIYCFASLFFFLGLTGTKLCRCAAKPGNLHWLWPYWSVPSNQWSCCQCGKILLDTQGKARRKLALWLLASYTARPRQDSVASVLHEYTIFDQTSRTLHNL